MFENIVQKDIMCPRCGHTLNSLWHAGFCGPERHPTDAIIDKTNVLADVGAGEILGIDLSHWQGDNFPWEKAKAAGVRFAYIKITQGVSYVDPTAKRNFEKAKDLDIAAGFYHYFEVDKDGASQMGFMLKAIGSMVPDLPLCCDAEDPAAKSVPKKTITDRLYKFAKAGQGFAGWPEIWEYTRKSWWDTYVNYDYPWHKLGLWNAYWGNNAMPIPKPWMKEDTTWIIHQYGIGKIGGVNVDHNRWNPKVPFIGDDEEPGEPGEPGVGGEIYGTGVLNIGDKKVGFEIKGIEK